VAAFHNSVMKSRDHTKRVASITTLTIL